MYKNIVTEGDIHRLNYKNGIDAYIDRLNRESNDKRTTFMDPENFKENIEQYRQKYIDMLGINNIDQENLPEPSLTQIAKDDDAVIYRVNVYITKEIPMYGLLFVPESVKKAPLVIAQHGGGGTPELCSDMNGKNKYNHIVRRLLKKGVIVFAPQLLLWNCHEALETQPLHPIKHDRRNSDAHLKRFGISITALEIKGIMNSITFLSGLEFVDENRIAMTGLSYGGYFTLYTMAADVRIKAGFSNACFNDRNKYPWSDWCYNNSANTFHDAEVAALCAPRKLYVAVGDEDPVFSYETAVPEAKRAEKYFEALSCPENFIFNVWNGGHTISSTDEGFDFMLSAFL